MKNVFERKKGAKTFLLQHFENQNFGFQNILRPKSQICWGQVTLLCVFIGG